MVNNNERVLKNSVTQNRKTLLAQPTIDKDNIVSKPWRKGKWLIWPNTIFSNIELADCNDTVEGICYRDKTISECLDRCPDGACGAGVYVQIKKGKSFCAPIRTELHPKLSPLYRLRDQSIYGLDTNKVRSSIFVNTELFPFPPNLSNTVFFGDILSIMQGDMGVDTEDALNKGEGTCVLKKSSNSFISLQPLYRTATPLTYDRPLVYGDSVAIVVSGTSLVAQLESDNTIVWKESLGMFGINSIMFTVIPGEVNRKIGDLVTFSDTVALDYEGRGLIATNNTLSNNTLYLNDSPSLMDHSEWVTMLKSTGSNINSMGTEQINFNVFFKFKSMMEGYYCDRGVCKTIPIKEITPVPFPGDWNLAPPKYVLCSGTYKGKSVYNRSGCWGICDLIKKGKKSDTGPISLSGEQHLQTLSTSDPPTAWQKKNMKTNMKKNMKTNMKTNMKKNMKTNMVLWVIIGIALAILIVTVAVLAYKHLRKPE